MCPACEDQITSSAIMRVYRIYPADVSASGLESSTIKRALARV